MTSFSLAEMAQLRQLRSMDTIDRSAERYSRGAIALHWTIAVLIIANILGALISEDMPKPQRMAIMSLHEANGLLILLLSFVRLGWRFAHRPPPLLETLQPWEAALARVTHFLFYFMMIALPLTGWALVSAFSQGKPVSFFGLFNVPALPVPFDKPTGEMFETMHGVLGWSMIALIVLHIAGALKHQFLDHDGTLRRMLPFVR